MSQLQQAIETIKKLRDPQKGCPWDLKQTHESLLKYLFEESYEFESAVGDKDTNAMKDELGDILLQVLLHSTIAEENNDFTLEDIAQNLKEKMIRRHPHVFGQEDQTISSEQVKKNWEEIKNEEKKPDQSLFPASYMNFPSLTSSYKIGKRSSEVNFDWEDYSQVSYKVEEEWQELKEELAPSVLNKKRIEEEMGDFLFSIAQLARHLDIDPDMALRRANKKFLSRFSRVEDLVKKDAKNIRKLDQNQIDSYWNQAKRNETKK